MNKTTLGAAVKLFGIGWYVAASIFVGTIIGVVVDRWLGSSPITTLGGLFLALFVVFWGVWHMAEALFCGEKQENKKKQGKEE